MKGYGKCPDCGLEIPFGVGICPYCARGFEVKLRKFYKSEKKWKRKK